MGRGPDSKPRVRRTKEEIEKGIKKEVEIKSQTETKENKIIIDDKILINKFPKDNYTSSLFQDKYNDKIIQLFDQKTKDVFIETNVKSVFELYKDINNNIKKIKTNDGFDFNNPFAMDNGFRGGSKEQIFDSIENKFDQKQFLESKNKLTKTIKNLSFLEEEISRKRFRKMSEHDGELDFDRIWDRNQFYSTEQKNKGIERTVEVNVDFGFNFNIKHENINKYGCLIWSIIDVLESNGVNCTVNLCSKTIMNSNNNKVDSSVDRINNQYIKIKVKDKSEYIETIEMAKCFTSNFFRRAMFNLYAVQLDSLGIQVPYCLGKGVAQKAESKKGVLNFSIDHSEILQNNFEQLKDFIRKAL